MTTKRAIFPLNEQIIFQDRQIADPSLQIIESLGEGSHGLDLIDPKLLIPLRGGDDLTSDLAENFFILGKISAKQKRSEITEAYNYLKKEGLLVAGAGSNRRPWGYESQEEHTHLGTQHKAIKQARGQGCVMCFTGYKFDKSRQPNINRLDGAAV